MAPWLFACRRPGSMPHDARLDFALALAVLRLAPEEKRTSWRSGEAKGYGMHIGHRVRKEVGVHIRQTLYILAKNMTEAINREADRKNDLKIALSKSFKQERLSIRIDYAILTRARDQIRI